MLVFSIFVIKYLYHIKEKYLTCIVIYNSLKIFTFCFVYVGNTRANVTKPFTIKVQYFNSILFDIVNDNMLQTSHYQVFSKKLTYKFVVLILLCALLLNSRYSRNGKCTRPPVTIV